jgi:hypothetical protein
MPPKQRTITTSVIIKDETDQIHFRKDFVYNDVAKDYFEFMTYKTGAIDSEYVVNQNGIQQKTFRLQLIYDLDTTYDKRNERYF